MCGIIGYIGSDNATPYIIEGLKRLEYRGYDSAGVAVCDGENFTVVKQKGRIANLEEELKNHPVNGTVGIGHTRWATHGEPSDLNSHPHLGKQSKIAVVHNGIIENYKELRAKLSRRGIECVTETDSEVVAQLMEYYYKGDLIEAVIKTVNQLEGSYALGIMCKDEPDKIIAVKKENPLIIGGFDGSGFIASDVPAVLKHTRTIYHLNDKEIATVTRHGVSFQNINREVVSKWPETIEWSFDSAEKGGYEHFMLKEIHEQPKVVKETIGSLMNGMNKDVLDKLCEKTASFNKIIITACGTACYSGSVVKYIFEKICRMPVEVVLASEFRYSDPIVDEKTLVILISQSGETADTIAAMREAKARGAVTFSIVNAVGSTIAKETHYNIYTAAGPEIAVASTKAFSTQLISLYIFCIRFAKSLGKINDSEEQDYYSEISAIPDKITSIIENSDVIKQYAAKCFNSKSIFFIGRNIDYAISMEGSLKLKELAYIHSEAYAGGELKHGTIALIEENTTVVAIGCCKRLFSKTWSNVEQVITRGAKVLYIQCEGGEATESEHVSVANVPDINELFSPSLSVIQLQLFAYYIAANKGCDIDKPRNLAKSVTVE
ncbi:MAG: glutamine--fructose-6-phosphate transaminase (isomerizing) [Clostridiales bacterium]|jgi:glucosamine--fructose-6-phosphate aminotransferase (isomerizing)|nr:glutamine--fructose-6-phosphate transaminase (isomerizing) [Clostridiales bacterium]